MSIFIKEYLNSKAENSNITVSNASLNLSESYNYSAPISKDSIMQEIEGIHVGPTRNFNWYTENALKSSQRSWTHPYQKPLIMNHNEKDGKIIGRIVSAEYVTTNTRSNTPAILFTCNIPDKEGKEQILDGRLQTTSIGVIVKDATCSICGQQIELDEYGNSTCGHVKGEMYEGKTCYWMIHEMEAKELSYVIVPSDIYAHNIRTYKPEQKDLKSVAENLNNEKLSIAEALKEGVKTMAKIEEVSNSEIENKENDINITESKEDNKENTKKDVVDENKEKTAEETIEELKEENKTLKQKLETIENSLTAIKKELEDTKKDLTSEIELKEHAEEEISSLKAEIKESLQENLNSYRTLLNKNIIAKESLEARSIDSLKDAIFDLKEEYTNLNSVKEIKEAEDPTLKSGKNSDINVKESKSDSNIDLEENVLNLFNDIF